MLNTKMFSKNLLKGFSNGQKFSNNIIKNFNLKQFGGKKDWDFDGVINKKDCQPRNTMRQDFSLKAGVPIADYPESFGYKRKLVYMSPQQYMKKAWISHGKPGTIEEYEKRNIFPQHLDKIKTGLQVKEQTMPTPWLETKKGKLIGQEGRHRVVAARELGYKKVPVYVIETSKDYIEKQELKSAPIKKQQEWRTMPQEQQYVERTLKYDTDGDAVPDEYDCQPQDSTKQEFDWKKHMEEVKRKKQEQWKTYQSKFSKYNTPSEKAYVALRLAAERHRQEVETINERERRIYEAKQAITGKPYASVNVVTNVTKEKIETQPIKTLTLSEQDAGKVARDIYNFMDNMFLEDEAKEMLGKELYGKEYYHELTPKEKSKVLYYVRKHAVSPHIGSPALQPASINKQQEWQNKTEMEKDVDRITKKDTDTDGVVDENDCQPLNEKEDGKIIGNNAILYHGTSKKNYESIKQTGLQPKPNYWGQPVVFLAPTFAGANKYAKQKKGVVLEVAVPLSQLTNYTENDILNEVNTYSQILVPNKIQPNQIKVIKDYEANGR